MALTRQQILASNYRYPSHLISLKPTKHFLKRTQERVRGFNCVPTMVRITKDNIYCATLSKNRRSFSTVVVRLKYTNTSYIFVCFNPYNGYVKTIWFEDSTRRNENRRQICTVADKPAVPNTRGEDALSGHT